MKWGVFSLSQIPDQSLRVEVLDEHLKQFKLAEDLGYDSIWLAEHLFSTYGIVTSTQVLAAAVAQVTKRVRIGTAVVVIPFNHPLRTAGDFGLVDMLSHGRLEFGVGRAYQPHEFIGLGIEMEKSREMFQEGLDIILKAWTQERISYEGKFWKIPQPVEVLPKPVQRPHPPVWVACISAESFAFAAEKQYEIQMATPFSYRIYREKWREKLQEQLERYEELCRQKGQDPHRARRSMLVPLFCHPDRVKARELYGEYVTWFYRKVSGHQLGAKQEEVIVKGYELSMRENIRSMKEGFLEFDQLDKYGAVCASDPDGCVEYLVDLQQRLGIDEFILWTNLAGLPHQHCEDSMRLVMDKVIPRVNAQARLKGRPAHVVAG